MYYGEVSKFQKYIAVIEKENDSLFNVDLFNININVNILDILTFFLNLPKIRCVFSTDCTSKLKIGHTSSAQESRGLSGCFARHCSSDQPYP